MFKQTLITTIISLSMASMGHSAISKKKSTKLKKSDIVSILKSDAEKNILVVETKSGQIYRLKVSKKQREELEGAFQVASTSSVKAPASTGKAKPAATVKKAVAEIKKEEPKKSPWSFGLVYYGTVGMESLSQNTGSAFNMVQLSAGYKAENGIKYTLKPSVHFLYNLESAETTNALRDPIFEVSKGSIAKFGDVNLNGTARYYIPLSTATRDSGSRGTIWGRVITSVPITKKVGFSYTFNPSYALQTKRVVAEFDAFDRITGSPSHNVSFAMRNTLGLSQDITDTIGLGQSIGHYYRLRYTDFGLDDQKPQSDLELAAEISWSGLGFGTLIFEISQGHSLNSDSGEGFSLLKASDSAYALIGVFPL